MQELLLFSDPGIRPAVPVVLVHGGCRDKGSEVEKIPSAEVRRGVPSVKIVFDAALDLLDGSF